MSEAISFLGNYLFVLWFGWAIAGVLYKYLRPVMGVGMIGILSLGMIPGLMSLMLYYELLAVTWNSSLAVLSVAVAVSLILGIWFRKPMVALIEEMWAFVVDWYHDLPSKTVRLQSKIISLEVNISKPVVYTLIFVIFLYLFLDNWLYISVYRAIAGHDITIYASQGDVFFFDKSIDYVRHRVFQETQFYYFALHGFALPLLQTWEDFFSDVLLINSNLFFKSISGFYSLLTMLTIVTLFWRRGILTGVVIAGVILMTYGIYQTFVSFHIDAMRIFFVTYCFVLSGLAVKHSSRNLLILLSVVGGLSSFIHSLSFMIAGLCVLVVAYFLGKTHVSRLKLAGIALLVLLLFGGIHYVLDVFLGTGWIFQTIKFH